MGSLLLLSTEKDEEADKKEEGEAEAEGEEEEEGSPTENDLQLEGFDFLAK